MDHRDNVVKSFRIVCEMLQDRAKHDFDRWSYPELSDISDDDLRVLALKQVFAITPSSSKQLRIVYSLQTKFKPQDVRKLVASGEVPAESDVILLAYDHPSSINVKTLKSYLSRIQIFDLEHLLYNVTKHVSVPLHEVMTDSEVSEMMTLYNIKSRAHLPHIVADDPVARYLALQPGQVVRITRPSPSAGVCVIYRHLVG